MNTKYEKSADLPLSPLRPHVALDDDAAMEEIKRHRLEGVIGTDEGWIYRREGK